MTRSSLSSLIILYDLYDRKLHFSNSGLKIMSMRLIAIEFELEIQSVKRQLPQKKTWRNVAKQALIYTCNLVSARILETLAPAC